MLVVLKILVVVVAVGGGVGEGTEVSTVARARQEGRSIAHRVSGVSTCDASVTTQPASATQPVTMSRPRPAFATTNGSLGGHHE